MEQNELDGSWSPGVIRALAAINQAIAIGGAAPAVGGMIVEQARALTGADTVLILVADEAGRAGVLAAAPAGAVDPAALSVPLEQADAAVRDRLGVDRADTLLAAPIADGGGVRGLLVAHLRAPGEAPPGARFWLECLADQAALALRCARLTAAEDDAAAAHRSEERFRALLEAAPDATIIVDRQGNILLVNTQAERLFGVASGELIGSDFDRLIPARYRAAHAGHHVRYFENPELRPMGIGMELYALRGDGTEFPVEVSLSPLETDEGLRVTAVVRDITERKLAEKALRDSEQHLRTLLNTLPVGVWMADADGDLILGNPAGVAIWGGSRRVRMDEYDVYRGWWADTGKRIEAREWGMARAVTRGETSLNEIIDIESFDGVRKTISHSAAPIRADDGRILGGVVVNEDITERRRIEQERIWLLEAEREKSRQLALAIREAHHRIKNNLQAITDLLSLELVSVGEPGARDALRDSLERVQAIALVHDLLSHHEDVQTVDAGRVVERVVPMVLQSAGLDGGGVVASVETSSILLPSKQATTVALVVNELVSNSAKHAFAGRSDGRIRVRLSIRDARVDLEVEDDGPGLPPGFEPSRHASVGLQVVTALVKNDLGGELTFENDDGLRVAVRFPAAHREKADEPHPRPDLRG
jgi:PAS domain S-box-containing protein